MTEKNKEVNLENKSELSSDIARAAISFLDRTQITGAEANAMMIVKAAINKFINK